MVEAIERCRLDSSELGDVSGAATEFGDLLHDYFAYRAEALNTFVEPRLMRAERAECAEVPLPFLGILLSSAHVGGFLSRLAFWGAAQSRLWAGVLILFQVSAGFQYA